MLSVHSPDKKTSVNIIREKDEVYILIYIYSIEIYK